MSEPEDCRGFLSAVAAASVQRRIEETIRDAILQIEQVIKTAPRQSTSKPTKKTRKLGEKSLGSAPSSQSLSEPKCRTPEQRSLLSDEETDEEIFYHSDSIDGPPKSPKRSGKPRKVVSKESDSAESDSNSTLKPQPHKYRFQLDENVVDSTVEMPLEEKPEISTRSPTKPEPKRKHKKKEIKSEKKREAAEPIEKPKKGENSDLSGKKKIGAKEPKNGKQKSQSSDSGEESANSHLDSVLNGELTTAGGESIQSAKKQRSRHSSTPSTIESDFSPSSVPQSLQSPIKPKPTSKRPTKPTKPIELGQKEEGCGAELQKCERRRSLVMPDCENCIQPQGPYTVVSRGSQFSLATMSLPCLELSPNCKGIRIRFEVNHAAPGSRVETRATTIECEMPNFRCERVYVDGRAFVPLKK